MKQTCHAVTSIQLLFKGRKNEVAYFSEYSAFFSRNISQARSVRLCILLGRGQ